MEVAVCYDLIFEGTGDIPSLLPYAMSLKDPHAQQNMGICEHKDEGSTGGLSYRFLPHCVKLSFSQILSSNPRAFLGKLVTASKLEAF